MEKPKKVEAEVKTEETKAKHYLSSKGPKPTVIFIMGGPGSGKGTQCQKLTS